jgi:hypothetical protein
MAKKTTHDFSHDLCAETICAELLYVMTSISRAFQLETAMGA